MVTQPQFEARDPEYRARVEQIVANSPMGDTMGMVMPLIEPGRVIVEIPYDVQLTQHNGYLHAGTVTTIADTAAGMAAASLMPAGSNVLSVEFKINFMAPAQGDRFQAVGQVLRSGRTLTVAEAKVYAIQDAAPEETRLIAAMQATLIRVEMP